MVQGQVGGWGAIGSRGLGGLSWQHPQTPKTLSVATENFTSYPLLQPDFLAKRGF